MVEFDPQRAVVTLHHRGLPLALLPERRLVQRHGVPADGCSQEQAGHLPVFRQINQAFVQPGAHALVSDLLILQPDPSATHRTQAVERLGKFGAPGSDQPGQTDDRASVDLKREIDKPLPGKIVHAQHRKILRLGATVSRQRQPQFLRIA